MGLLAATSSGLVQVGRADAILFEDSIVSALTCHAEDVFAIVNQTSVCKIEDRSSDELATSETRLNCLDASAHGLFAGAAEARLLRLADGRWVGVSSFDQVPDRQDWFTPWGGPPDVRSLSRDGSGDMYANVHVGGILRSRDDGGSWEQTIDIHADVHEVVASQDSKVVVAATAWGVAVSYDGGAKWDISAEGLHASYCRAIALVDDTVFMTASVGPHGGRSAIYRRALDGSRFERCEQGLPDWFGDNIDTGCVAAAQDVVAFGTSDGSIYASEDAGASWSQAASGLAPVRWLEIVG